MVLLSYHTPALPWEVDDPRTKCRRTTSGRGDRGPTALRRESQHRHTPRHRVRGRLLGQPRHTLTQPRRQPIPKEADATTEPPALVTMARPVLSSTATAAGPAPTATVLSRAPVRASRTRTSPTAGPQGDAETRAACCQRHPGTRQRRG